ncbi:MAG: hypothetical protein KKH83_03390 [Candidatus Margulisbacteria bacterium]|nr:hypothetical protein [Candidatus Margulisiibacteriota bacterium]
MSDFNIAGQMSRETLHGLSKLNTLKQQRAAEELLKDQPTQQSQTTGLEWQAVASQNPNDKVQNPNKKEDIKLVTPQIEDLATISSTVRLSDDTLTLNRVGTFAADRLSFDVQAKLREFKDLYAQSRSHNLLYERFITQCKLAALQTVLGIIGVEPRMLIEMQAEVKAEALARIDESLQKDYAEALALMTIVG